MKGAVQVSIHLSHLVPSRRNPRKVKPSRESHERLVALIRAYGLLQPLLVRAIEGKSKEYEVLAGHRRLRALKEIHRNDGNPRIPCILRDVDSVTADAFALAENFPREGMHPLDEAEAFAHLAAEQAKGVEAIASEFGVLERYVRQRMKLANLAGVVKTAYRAGEIDTSIAEAFASVPEERQTSVWQELNGHPRHADQVRNIIATAWIDATHALFVVASLPESEVSRDLFSERVLIERQAFMTAQAEALVVERASLIEDGWANVVAGRYEEVHGQTQSMDIPEREFDEETSRKLTKLGERYQTLETKWNDTPDEDERTSTKLQEKLEAMDAEREELERQAPVFYSEARKSTATMFLMLLPSGEVRRECRIPRRRLGISGQGTRTGDESSGGGAVTPPTSDDLSDRQLAITFTQQAIGVREALLKNDRARKRILALILHDKVRAEGLAIRHEPNSTTLHAASEGFVSPAFDRLRERRSKLDPFVNAPFVEGSEGSKRLSDLSTSKLDALIDLLIVACVTAHLQRRTALVCQLAVELKVNIRDFWQPDATWLSSFQKIQLAHLMIELKGPAHAPAPEKKKSELVEALAVLFTDAADGKLEDKELAKRINAWTPSNLRPISTEGPKKDTETK